MNSKKLSFATLLLSSLVVLELVLPSQYLKLRLLT